MISLFISGEFMIRPLELTARNKDDNNKLADCLKGILL